MHRLAHDKHLFIDNRLIARQSGVCRTVNRPRLIEEPVIVPGPEGSYNDAWVGGFGNVIDDDGLYKMWVHGRSAAVLAGRAKGPDASPAGEWERLATQKSLLPMGYYTSSDGVHWDAPNLGLFEWNGSKANNIVCLDWGYVFKDPQPRDPSQRYKMISHPTEALGVQSDKEARSLALGGVYIFTSPDGIRWTFSPKRLVAVHPDCNNMMIYDTRINKHVAYLRSWPGKLKRNYGRAVARVELDDPMEPWPTLPVANPRHFWGPQDVPASTTQFATVMSYPGYEADDAWTDIYDPNVVQYPWARDVYLAFPELNHRLHTSPISNHSRLDVGMCVSRDGIAWDWPSLDAYVPFGPDGSGRTGMLYNIVGMLRRGDEIYQYISGTSIEHGMGVREPYERLLNSGRIWRVVQRLDGFVSMDFTTDGGEMLTEPFLTDGPQAQRLTLNVDAANGSLKVEIADEAGRAIAGYSLGDCDEIRSDATAAAISWKGKPTIAAMKDRPVRLRIVGHNAKLYAMQFV